MKEKMFIHCEVCGKRLIERLPNGLFKFLFGRNPDRPGDPPVQLLIHGSIKMKCWSELCRSWNTFNYFPSMEENDTQSALPKQSIRQINSSKNKGIK